VDEGRLAEDAGRLRAKGLETYFSDRTMMMDYFKRH
jgi:hypothetical protein